MALNSTFESIQTVEFCYKRSYLIFFLSHPKILKISLDLSAPVWSTAATTSNHWVGVSTPEPANQYILCVLRTSPKRSRKEMDRIWGLRVRPNTKHLGFRLISYDPCTIRLPFSPNWSRLTLCWVLASAVDDDREIGRLGEGPNFIEKFFIQWNGITVRLLKLTIFLCAAGIA